MIVKRIAVSTFLAVTLAALVPATAASAEARKGLEGTWIVAVEIADPPPGFPAAFTALESYARGGSLVTSNDNPLVSRTGQGAWDRDGNDYVARIVFFVLDESGAPAGTIHVIHRIGLSGSEAYVGAGEAELRDASGATIATLAFTSRGERITP
jgi:hypothetical protein